MIKLFNERKIVLCTISFAVGILLYYLFFINLILFISILVGLFILLVATLFFTLKKKLGLREFIKQKKIILIIMCVFLILGLVLALVYHITFNANVNAEGYEEMYVKIESVRYEDEKIKAVVSDIKLIDENGKRIKGKGYLYIENDFEAGERTLESGNVIRLKGFITPQKMLADNKFNSYFVKNNIHYTINVKYNDFDFVTDKKDFVLKVRQKVYDIFSFSMPHSKDVAFALIFGDTTNIDQDELGSFREIGLAHIFAVSGLHIGFLCSILYFVLKKLKTNRFVNVGIISICLFTYSMLAGFTPSVIRASIMSVTLCVCHALFCEYDFLTSISLSALILLFINPYYIVETGFLMSFACVISIALLNRPFNRLFRTNKIENKIARKLLEALSLSMSTTIGLLPFSIMYFGYFSFLGVLINIVAIPLISVIYTLLILLLIIALIIPPLKILLCVVDYMLYGISVSVNFLVGNFIVKANIKGIGMSLIPYYMSLVVVSDFVFLERKYKNIVASVGFTAFILLTLLVNLLWVCFLKRNLL